MAGRSEEEKRVSDTKYLLKVSMWYSYVAYISFKVLSKKYHDTGFAMNIPFMFFSHHRLRGIDEWKSTCFCDIPPLITNIHRP